VSIKELFDIRRMGHLISPVKVIFKSSVTNIRLGTLQIENIMEGSSMSMPLWAANVLAKNGFVDIQEESFDEEFFRSVAKEKLLKDSVNLSQLADSFYVNLIDFVERKHTTDSPEILSRSDYLKIHNDATDLVAIRIRKLLHYARIYSDTTDILSKLTLEERILLQMFHNNVKEFSSAIFETGV
jgi:hypothetical protein